MSLNMLAPNAWRASTKFNGWKLWNLALEGITSFSTFPLRMWTYIGFVVAAASFFYGAWMIANKIFWK